MSNQIEMINGSIRGKVIFGLIVVLFLFFKFGYEPVATYYIEGIELTVLPDLSNLSDAEIRKISTKIRAESAEIERRTLHLLVFPVVINTVFFFCTVSIAVLTFKLQQFPPTALPIPWRMRVFRGRKAIIIGVGITLFSVILGALTTFLIWLWPSL